MTKNLECGLRYLDGALLAFYSLKKLNSKHYSMLHDFIGLLENEITSWFLQDGAIAHTANYESSE
jgi:hypothetical protein